jgi:hypothetical protein
VIFDRLAGRDRRALLLGVIALAPTLAWSYGVRPFRNALGERRDRAARESELLSRERALVEQAPRLPTMLAGSRRALDTELEHVVRSDAAATASVRLADYVRALARAHEVLVTQATEAPADSLAQGVLLLRLSVHGESDLQGILGFLRALETGTIRAGVATVQIERAPVRSTARGRVDDGREVLALNATIVAPAVLTAARGGER